MNADAYRDAWLSEMWEPVHEIPREERQTQREESPTNAQPVHTPVHKLVDRETSGNTPELRGEAV